MRELLVKIVLIHCRSASEEKPVKPRQKIIAEARPNSKALSGENEAGEGTAD
jgi:hypothetical protein